MYVCISYICYVNVLYMLLQSAVFYGNANIKLQKLGDNFVYILPL